MGTIHNIRKSALSALLCVALAPLPGQAQTEDAVSEYSVEVLWTSPNYLHDTGLSKAAHRSDFFVHDDVMYINYMYFGASELHMVDARTGTTIGDNDIEWNVDHSLTAASFVGTDSAGHPYLASLSTSEFDGYPLELFPLAFNGVRPTVNSVYTLPLSGRVWPRDPVVVGDISSGSFTVVATAWGGQEPISWKDGEAVYDGALLLWRVVDGVAAMPTMIRAKFSDCTLLPCGADSFLAYDRGFYDDIEDFDFSTPTLISVNTDNTISKLSVFDGHIENAYGAGVDVSEVGDRTVMFYGTGYQPATFAIATLPDYPVSIVRSELVRTFGAGELSVGNERRYALAAPNKGQVVHAVRVDDNTSRFYTMTDNNSLACVQVSAAGSGDVVQIAVDDSGTTEYFDLNGRPCTHPAAPGVYLQRQGLHTTKVILTPGHL